MDNSLAFEIPGGAELPPPSGIPAALQGDLQETGVNLLQLGLNLLFIAAMVLAVIVMLYSGLQWITSKGDAAKIKAARARLIYALLGVIVVVMAYFLIGVIRNLLGVTQ